MLLINKIKLIFNKSGASEFLTTILTIVISLAVGALIYGGFTTIMNGPVTNGLNSSFDVAEKSKEEIIIKNKEYDKKLIVEDFDFNETPEAYESTFFNNVSEVSINNNSIINGEKNYQAKISVLPSNNKYEASFEFIDDGLATRRLQSALSYKNISSAELVAYIDRTNNSSSNIVSSLVLITDIGSYEVNGTIEGNELKFDLNSIIKDDNLCGIVHNLKNFKISLIEGTTNSEFVNNEYILDDIYVILN